MSPIKGKDAFVDYYRSLFSDRFDAIFCSAKKMTSPVLLVRPDKESLIAKDWTPVPWFAHAYFWPQHVTHGERIYGVEEGWVYPLSLSSLLPVYALNVQSTDTVFDACAAPGGKTLGLYLSAQSVWANDISPDRTERLKRTIQRFGASGNVTVSQHVVEVLARRIDVQFDKILVDAPCSSELHVYRSPAHLTSWKYKRIESLRSRQVHMITSCLPLLSPHGRLVYSTCALTPEENECVIEEVVSHPDFPFRVVPINWRDLPGSDGLNGYTVIKSNMRRVWPDIDGLEPMFIAAFERII